ncbi:transcriptional regulator, AraC family [Hyphomonas neptunium ATCC 15444]|uniref:Transcriptional regulator, AraC family n=2 Tax=Hyphomonas TaxID=85 RepID=Q0C025_HYPNA|nr:MULTISPECIES: AraC family transcriptional regulator [Hyphomonas]ABI76703.1 transcriptional regulator, AraC family [Hyphomonas neptunium ATCC 15444]KCZ86606.1 AraC family transcriptional regulator [Hyphomonas hirschiana VP5]
MSAPLLSAVTAYVEANGGGQGRFETPMKGVHMVRTFQDMMPDHRLYRPSLCMVLQGAKQMYFGEDTLTYGAMEYLLVCVEVPASGRIAQATPTEPFIGLMIDFDVATIKDVLEHIDVAPLADTGPGPCVFVGQVDEMLADCALRLVKLAHTPKAVPLLYPSIMREICYWLLSSPYGGEIRKLALPETHVQRIANAVYLIRNNFSQTLRVEQLAEAARMSPSSFHQHFKSMTSMTPLQYQKHLRLLEARRLMLADAVSVTEAAYKVGYESASQFSREYIRMFGVTPKRDVLSLRVAAE